MNLEDVKKKLKEISRDVKLCDTSRPKIAIASLCDVIQVLIVEIENLKRPKITLTSPDHVVPIDTPQIPCTPTKSPGEEEPGPTEKPGPTRRSRGPRRRFNAGDAE